MAKITCKPQFHITMVQHLLITTELDSTYNHIKFSVLLKLKVKMFTATFYCHNVTDIL